MLPAVNHTFSKVHLVLVRAIVVKTKFQIGTFTLRIRVLVATLTLFRLSQAPATLLYLKVTALKYHTALAKLSMR